MVNNENNHKKHKMIQYANGKSLEEVKAKLADLGLSLRHDD